jgi:putative transposase
MDSMYINEATTLNYRQRLLIIKRVNLGWNKAKIARNLQVSRQTVYDVIARYKDADVFGLEDHRPGKRRETTNSQFYELVIAKRTETGFGAKRLEKHFKLLGFSVGHNKINRALQSAGLLSDRKGKMTKPKYIRYEAENVNDQWHMDWSRDPITNLHLLAIVDDKSRFVVYAGLFVAATAENTVIGYLAAIEAYGAPKEMVTDNGSHFKNIHANKVNKELASVEEKYGIKHIFIRAGHPQSNGKIERLFGSYQYEFPRMNHPRVHDCITYFKYHNEERIHQSLDYATPASVYKSVK